MFKKFILITIILSAFLYLLMPVLASAGIVPCGTSTTQPCTLCDIFKMIQILVNGFSVALLVWAALYITLGGIAILSSGGAPDKATQGKRMITYAIIGLIIAFGAWLIINETMLLLVGKVPEGGTNAFPWPWNQIKCVPSEGGGNGGGEEAECGAWCCCDLISGENYCSPQEYNSFSDCDLICQTRCTKSAGNELLKSCCLETKGKCSGTECGGMGPAPDAGEYCVCRTPRYAYVSGGDINTAPLVATDIKVTKLASLGECNQKCVSGNFQAYCYRDIRDLPSEKYTLRCQDKSSVTDKQGCGMTLADEYGDQGCRIGGACYRTDDECMNAASTTYLKKCFLDGLDLCSYYQKGGSTYCLTARSKGLDCDGKPDYYVLYRWKKEKPGTNYNLLECSEYSTGNYYCRSGCHYEECRDDSGGDGGTTPPSGWRFQSGVQYQTEQKADATTALTNFLNCFYEKAPNNIGYISAITDKDIYNGTCDPKICKTSSCTTDDCGSGKACDHECHSCHYGGTCTSAKSYAVDFGDETNVCAIATAANKCSGVNKIYGPQTCGGKVTDDNQHEDHVHISITSSCCGN